MMFACWLVDLFNDWMPFFLSHCCHSQASSKLQRARVKYINQSDGISSIHVVVVVCWPKTSRNPSKAPPQGEAGNVIF